MFCLCEVLTICTQQSVMKRLLLLFSQENNKGTQYTVSNYGGAQLIGKSGISTGKKVVT